MYITCKLFKTKDIKKVRKRKKCWVVLLVIRRGTRVISTEMHPNPPIVRLML